MSYLACEYYAPEFGCIDCAEYRKCEREKAPTSKKKSNKMHRIINGYKILVKNGDTPEIIELLIRRTQVEMHSYQYVALTKRISTMRAELKS